MNDFSKLKGVSGADLIAAVDNTIEKLGKFYSIPIRSEIDKLKIIEMLNDTLTPAKYKKLNEPLIVTEEVQFYTCKFEYSILCIWAHYNKHYGYISR